MRIASLLSLALLLLLHTSVQAQAIVGIDGADTIIAAPDDDGFVRTAQPLRLETRGAPGAYSLHNSGLVSYTAYGTEAWRLWVTDPDGANYNSGNIYLGFEAGRDQPSDNETAGWGNIAIGWRPLASIGTGYDNVALGWNAIGNLTSGYRNIALGAATMWPASTAAMNVAIGIGALNHVTTQSHNVAIGEVSAYYLLGERNVMIGSQVGMDRLGNAPGPNLVKNRIRTANDSVLIGYQATQESETEQVTNVIAIGSNVRVTKSGQTVIGTEATVETVLRGALLVPDADITTAAGAAWDLGAASAGAPAGPPTHTITVTIDGVTYRLAAEMVE